MWGYPFQGMKIVHEQMLQEALEHQAFPRGEKHARRSSQKHIFGAVLAHFTSTSAGEPQTVLLCRGGEEFCHES